MNTHIFKMTIILTFFSIGLLSCNKDDYEKIESGDVQFGLNSQNYKALKCQSCADIDSLIISIEKTDGTHVFTEKKLKLRSFGDYNITSPIALPSGEYKITEFLVMNNLGEVVYAAPKEGSSLAKLVSDPLPVLFTVAKNSVITVSPEVLEIGCHTPKDFGYASFSLNLIKTFQFGMAAFIFNDNHQPVFAEDASLTVIANSKIIFEGDLETSTNLITVADNLLEYTLIVKKTGYFSYQKTFTNSELKEYSAPNSAPVVVTLSSMEGLMLWNTLGSPSEIANSEVGPDLFNYDPLIDGYFETIAQQAFSPGLYGNALSIGAGNYLSTNRVHNVVLRDVSSVVNLEQGCVEFYYYQKEDPLAWKYGIYRFWDGAYGFNSNLSFWAADPSDNEDSGLFEFGLQISSTEIVRLKYDPGSGIRNNHHLNNRWLHLAIVWNINGIDETGNTMRIYIDGGLVACTNQNGWSTQHNSKPVDICGGNDNGIANTFFMEDLKVWNYSKTDFSN